jgi:hypothetical protein
MCNISNRAQGSFGPSNSGSNLPFLAASGGTPVSNANRNRNDNISGSNTGGILKKPGSRRSLLESRESEVNQNTVNDYATSNNHYDCVKSKISKLAASPVGQRLAQHNSQPTEVIRFTQQQCYGLLGESLRSEDHEHGDSAIHRVLNGSLYSPHNDNPLSIINPHNDININGDDSSRKVRFLKGTKPPSFRSPRSDSSTRRAKEGTTARAKIDLISSRNRSPSRSRCGVKQTGTSPPAQIEQNAEHQPPQIPADQNSKKLGSRSRPTVTEPRKQEGVFMFTDCRKQEKDGPQLHPKSDGSSANGLRLLQAERLSCDEGFSPLNDRENEVL